MRGLFNVNGQAPVVEHVGGARMINNPRGQSTLSSFEAEKRSAKACEVFRETRWEGKNDAEKSFWILESGQKCDIPEHEQMILPTGGLKVAHVAAFADHLEMLAGLVERDNRVPAEPSHDGYLPLHYACYGGSLECTVYLISQMSMFGCLNELRMNENLKSVHLLAAKGKHPKILQALLDAGITPSFSDLRKIAKTVIMNNDLISLKLMYESISECSGLVEIAMRHTRIEVARFLIEEGQPIDTDSFSGLQVACGFSDNPDTVELIRLLCSHSVSLEGSDTKTGPIHWVCGLGNYSVLEMLEQKGIDVNRGDKDGRCGLEYLLPLGKSATEVIQWMESLQKHGWSPSQKHIKSFLGAVLRCRNAKRYARVIVWLLQHGASIFEPVNPPHEETCKEWIEKMIAEDDFWREVLGRPFSQALAMSGFVEDQ